MRFPLRLSLSIVLFIALIIVGFMYLLRGCLSKYDERSITPKVLYFERGDQKIVFALVKFDKTIAYTQRGGFISKSVRSSYSIQSNDAITGDKLAEKKVRDNDDIKNHPADIMGAAGNYAWVFLNEPIVFDPFTLKIVATLENLEKINPDLKGRFPAEHRYYHFDNNNHNLYFTATDGTSWMINGQTFKASQQETIEKGVTAQIKQLEKLIKENRRQQDTLMEQNLRVPSRQLSAKVINLNTYKQTLALFQKERAQLDKKRDSLEKLKNQLEANRRSEDELVRRMESLQSGFRFSQAKLNADTANGKWFGIYSDQEIDNLYERFSYQPAYNETARRQWFSSTYAPAKWGGMIIDKANAEPGTCIERFLDGGFLVDNQTGKPLRLKDSAYLVIYKNQIGREGKIQLALVSNKGITGWTTDTGLTEWSYYIFNGDQLIITAKQHEELSGNECNILTIVNLFNGNLSKFDYFTQKILPNPNAKTKIELSRP